MFIRNIFILFLINIVGLTVSIAQTGFNWEKIDSTSKDKSQLYSDTKIFISKYWKSAQDVIQNDDIDGGIIIVKGKNIQKINHSVCTYTYVYNYTATFMFKDGKYKFTLGDVHCEDAYPIGCSYSIAKIEPFDDLYNKGQTTFTTGTLPEKKAKQLMSVLKSELQQLYQNYLTHIAQKNSDW
jgi:hypothetical protein